MFNVHTFFFFFSSRRRHTRWPRDWSSDVCSSDLHTNKAGGGQIENSEDQNKCTDDFSDRIACIISYFRNCGKNGEVDTRILRGSEVISVSQIDENGPDECAKKLRSEEIG